MIALPSLFAADIVLADFLFYNCLILNKGIAPQMRSLFGDAVSHSMNERNTNYLKHHIDILSFRDLAPGTIATYSSYMTQYIDWVEANLGAEQLSDVTWEEI